MRINSKNCKIVAKKEFRGLINEKTIVLALLLQLFIAMFSSFLLVGLASMYNPDAMSQYSKMKYPIAYAGETSHLYVKLMDDPNLIVYPMELSPAVSALSERQLAAVVWVPKNMEEITRIIREEIEYKGVSVIIPQRECMQTLARKNRQKRAQ